MRPLRSISPLFVRTKATLNRTYKNNKSGERPPYRPPDPLVDNPRAVATRLAEGDLTFIHRPPPTAPTPFSLTTNPSSPLLRPPTASRITTTTAATAATAADDNAHDRVSPIALPPELGATTTPTPSRMSDEALAELRRLRLSDPHKYTRGVLAKMFGCTNAFVGYVAALRRSQRKPITAAREAAHAKRRERWGGEKSLAKAIKRKRREFW